LLTKAAQGRRVSRGRELERAPAKFGKPMRVHEIPVGRPYRLDLTATVLRRLSTNVVDLLTPDGVYVRALSGFRQPVIVRVAQVSNRGRLSVAIEGDSHDDAAVLALVGRMLGAKRDLEPFYAAASRIGWLASLAGRMRGVKPPRYPTLWEACANAIVFQQLSVRAASAIMHRLIVNAGQRVDVDDLPVPAYLFPTVERFRQEADERLRAAGLSASKVATLRRVAEALESGALDASTLDRCTSSEAAALLCRIKGIGPWTAAVILLRGFGRLDVFPGNDTSIASNVALAAGSDRYDIDRVLDTLGPQRGMLYFHLLLARLEVLGDIGRPSFT
jgi:DNA-3-methyladenine glycosylase II